MAESIERVLRWSTPSKDALAATQKLLENEVAQPLLMYAARGQRALLNEALTKLEGANGAADPAVIARIAGADGAAIPADQWKDVEWLKANHAVILEQYAALTELAAAPEVERPLQLHQAEEKLIETANIPERNLARMAIGPIVTFARNYLANQAELEAAITALAAERYRLDAGRFPNAAGQLVQNKVIDKNPVDPLDGLPMKIIPFDTKGCKIYSIGPDGKDDGGKFDRAQPGKTGTDIVFRLWAPAQRGAEKK